MKVWARIFAVLLAAVVVCAAFGGCGKSGKKDGGNTGSDDVSSVEQQNESGESRAEQTSSKTASKQQTASTAGGKQQGTKQLTFWCGYGTDHYNRVQKLVDLFNSKQKNYRLKLASKGGTGELRTSLMSTAKANLPSLFNGTPLTNAHYAENSFCAPIQPYIDADPDKWANDMFEPVRWAYSDRNGKLIGAPIGLSITGWGVNLDVLQKAGYSEKDCTSFEAMVNIAIDAVKQGLVKYGMTINNGVDIHDALRLQGVDLVDKNNGWSGDPASSQLEKGNTNTVLKKFLTLEAKLYNEGAGYPMTTTGNVGGQFKNGSILFWRNTNSYFSAAIVNTGQPNFHWGFIPAVGVDNSAKYKNQCLAEGTGVYIANTGDEREMQGAYEFIKFCASVEAQRLWCGSCTYTPFTKKAAADPEIVKWQNANFPEWKNVINVLNNSKSDLRGTYAAIGSEMTNSLFELAQAVSDNPKGNIDTYIKNANQRFQQGIDQFAMIKQAQNKK